MSDKCGGYEKDREEKENVINIPQCEVSSLKERIDVLKKISDNSEQYSRRNCLLWHGVKEQEQEKIQVIFFKRIKGTLRYGIVS